MTENNVVEEESPQLELLSDAELQAALEAMLLVVDSPAPTDQLAAAIGDGVERVEAMLRRMAAELTRAALETLAVVAYRQPLTRARISGVRGVNVDGVIRTLLARGLIAESGTDADSNGTLYVTTELFLERLGLASLTDLPALAPLLPDVDLIDEINDSAEMDTRVARMRKTPASATEPPIETED